ncbi:MAG: hypothetical protein U5K37_07710 [Natrialbaceae archaeon]|nr:hypothetical protein [Natrialbaceae archaeon]
MLQTQVAIRERGKPLVDISADYIARIYITLYHDHLPKVVDAGLLQYDQEREHRRTPEYACSPRPGEKSLYLYITPDQLVRMLIYGAYGYTGTLITDAAVERGHEPIVAGRDGARTEALATRHGLESRVFSLEDAHAHLDDAEVVLHAAGPFEQTARPMVEACPRDRGRIT